MESEVKVGNCLYSVRSTKEGRLLNIDIAGRRYRVDAVNSSETCLSLLIDNKPTDAIVDRSQDSYAIAINGQTFQVEFFDPRSRKPADGEQHLTREGRQTILAPMAGQIRKICVQPGDLVKDGEGLVVLEAMKMENELKSRGTGEVREIFVHAGDIVTPGQRLLTIE